MAASCPVHRWAAGTGLAGVWPSSAGAPGRRSKAGRRTRVSCGRLGRGQTGSQSNKDLRRWGRVDFWNFPQQMQSLSAPGNCKEKASEARRPPAGRWERSGGPAGAQAPDPDPLGAPLRRAAEPRLSHTVPPPLPPPQHPRWCPKDPTPSRPPLREPAGHGRNPMEPGSTLTEPRRPSHRPPEVTPCPTLHWTVRWFKPHPPRGGEGARTLSAARRVLTRPPTPSSGRLRKGGRTTHPRI